MDTPVPVSKNSTLWIVLLLVFLVLAGLFVALGNGSTTTTTTTEAVGHCPGFDPQQEAYTLAVQAEQWRKANPFGGNYANTAFIICFTNGKTVRDGVRPVKGYTSGKDPATNWTTHSEQGVYAFLRAKLIGYGVDPTQILAVDVVVFSQVRVCGPCQQSIVVWQTSLRQAMKTPNLYLSVWNLGTHGFDPATFPAGIGTPVVPDDVVPVPITFTP